MEQKEEADIQNAVNVAKEMQILNKISYFEKQANCICHLSAFVRGHCCSPHFME